jgi:ATP-dependent exoDNAse (exonuclease V) alpha subunit
MPEHSRTTGTDILLEEKDADASGNKLFLAVTMERFRKDFRPAYCITSYKAQGDTIEGVYGIHELDEIGANGAYVCLTRATDPKNIVVFKTEKKMTAFMKYMQECEAADRA